MHKTTSNMHNNKPIKCQIKILNATKQKSAIFSHLESYVRLNRPFN